MKQIWPNYSYSPTTNVLTLTGLNIDRDQLLLVSAPERGRIMYNFADSATTASAFTAGANTGLTLVASTAGLTTTAALVIYYDDQLTSSTVTVSSLPAISGTVTANLSSVAGVVGNDALIPPQGIQLGFNAGGEFLGVGPSTRLPVELASNTLVQVDGGSITVNGSVALEAGTAQIGSVTASISNFPVTQPISIASVTIGNSVTIGSLPAISGTVTANVPLSVDVYTAVTGVRVIGVGYDGGLRVQGIDPSNFSPANIEEGGGIPIFSVNNNALPISGTVTANTFALQGTAVTTSNFTSTTASTVLAGFNATREVLTIFNEGAGNLHICAGATCTTIAYQVRLSSGDYYEVPNHQTTITHSAVFATAGTARVTQVS